MFQRFRRPQAPPLPPARSESLWRRQVNRLIETQISRYPALVQLRAVFRQLQDERELWPVLIPLLVAVFLGTYRVERRKVKRDS